MMTVERYVELCQLWLDGDKVQRLGQWLINNLEDCEPQPDIFYEKNPSAAACIFFDRFVIKED